MNYKDFNLGDWIGHISGVIEDETTLDGNEMRDLVEFLTTLQQEPCDKCVYSTSEGCQYDDITETIPPFDDCISRQAVIDMTGLSEWFDSSDSYNEFVIALSELPPATSQPKMGHWINDVIQGEIDGQIVKAFICSECGAISVFRITDGKIVNGDLCPNCCAKMTESEE